MSTDKGVVLSLFADEAAADAAVEQLKEWDKLDDDVKLNAISIIVLDEDGNLKMHKVGKRRGILKGVAAGAVAVVLAGWIITPLELPILLGLAGATRKKLPLTDEREQEISDALVAGGAAVGVLVKLDQLFDVAAKLNELGGSTDSFGLTPELIEAATEVSAASDDD